MRDMLGRGEAVTVTEALRLLKENVVFRNSSEEILIEEAYGRVLSEDIISPDNLPGFNRSTVDGFAVIASDTFGATESMPAYLEVKGEVLMGEEPSFGLKKGEAVRIATGGMLPDGADAVVMLEHVQFLDGKLIEVLKPVTPKENIISFDEDVRSGEVILEKGKRLRPQDVAALAGVGIIRIRVYKKPIISIISTGDEIVPASSPVRPGKVRDINSYNLAGLITLSGGKAVKKGIFRDIYDEIREVLKESLSESDMVIITGGSSVGARDLTEEVINSLGSPGVLFHGVNLKPGKPTIGAVIDGIPVLGLPGHPAAVSVCFELFASPLIAFLSGERKRVQEKNRVKARLTRNISSTQGREEHIRVRLEDRDGVLWATPVLGKSGLIRTLVYADGKIIIPSHLRGIEAGEEVEVILFQTPC
ncbi:MAG: gephyrin-like molybdotransferase Glp [Thermodesulfovibrionales bacterium]